ncbi:MAG TPA: periplasmic heavy metal sensor [Steroidobacteraceae bacterium]|nr:periplasmic heavy metal sensor [Steroidobacteraceae bacterium]
MLNLFLLAVIGGHLWRAHTARAVPRTLIARVLRNVRAELSAHDAAAFGAVISRDEPRFAGSAQQLLDARRELDRQIEAERFDRAAATRALAAWRMSSNLFLDQFDSPLIDALSQVSPQGRRRLVEHARGARRDL